MAKAIAERHEIVVETDESVFTLTADSRDGRLLIQQRKKNGRPDRGVCALSLSNPGELADFFDGLRRVLSSTGIRIAEDDARPQKEPAALLRSAPRSMAAGPRTGTAAPPTAAGAEDRVRDETSASRLNELAILPKYVPIYIEQQVEGGGDIPFGGFAEFGGYGMGGFGDQRAQFKLITDLQEVFRTF